MKQSRYNFLVETEKEKEGYQKSVKSLLMDCEKIKELGKGMHGILANIISVPSEYETAIEMCLGASLQNIVTDSEEDAKKLVEHLRKNDLGRASFLPITSVKGKKLEKIKGKNVGVIGIASDLVSFDKKYEQIILNLLGKTVAVDNMENAIKVAKNGAKVKVSWKNVSAETGYQISRAATKTGTNIIATYKTATGESKVVSAAKNKAFYYKIRAYRIVNGKYIYGAWSEPVKFTRK